MRRGGWTDQGPMEKTYRGGGRPRADSALSEIADFDACQQARDIGSKYASQVLRIVRCGY